MLRDQTWVLTGAAGRIATGLRPHLAGQVRRLRLVDVVPVAAKYDGEEAIVADLRDPDATQAAIAGADGVGDLVDALAASQPAVTLDQLGKATRDGAGWHQSLEGLERALEGEKSRDHDPDRWRDLRDLYAQRFGPEASRLGPPKEWEDVHGSAPRSDQE